MTTSTTTSQPSLLPHHSLQDAIKRSNKYIRAHTIATNMNSEPQQPGNRRASTCSIDSNNPSLLYNEYDSDSSRDEELYSYQPDETSTPQTPCPVTTDYEFHVTDIHYIPPIDIDNDKELELSVQHEAPDHDCFHLLSKHCLPLSAVNMAWPQNSDRDEKKMENEALQIRLQQQQQQRININININMNSPVCSPVISTTMSTELLPFSPPAKKQRSATCSHSAFSSHAPSQSITDEILFEFVALSDEDEYAVDVSAQKSIPSCCSPSSRDFIDKHRKFDQKKPKKKPRKDEQARIRKKSGSKSKKSKSKRSPRRQRGCESVKHCVAVKRLAKAMKWYQKYGDDAEKLYSKLESAAYVDCMLNDYQHVLDVHLSHLHGDDNNNHNSNKHVEYQRVRERVQAKLKHACDAHSCAAVQRLMSNEYEGGVGSEGNMVTIHNMKDKIEFYAHSIDLIHCYLLHLECLN